MIRDEITTDVLDKDNIITNNDFSYYRIESDSYIFTTSSIKTKTFSAALPAYKPSQTKY